MNIDRDKWITLEELVESKIFPITVRALRTLLSKRDKNGIVKHFKKIGTKWVTTINEFSEWLKNTDGQAKHKYPERVYTKRRGRPPKYYRASMISIEEQQAQEKNFLFLKRKKIKSKEYYKNLNLTVPYEKIDTFLVDPPQEILNREGLDRIKTALKTSVRDYTQYKPIRRSKYIFINMSTTIEEILNEDPFSCDTFRRIRKINQVGHSKYSSTKKAEKKANQEKEERQNQTFHTHSQNLTDIFNQQGTNEQNRKPKAPSTP